jgi:CTP:molybdopterin cytidylyltransferase MocA
LSRRYENVKSKNAETLRCEVAHAQARVIVNEEWGESMAPSIHCGLAALEAATGGSSSAAVALPNVVPSSGALDSLVSSSLDTPS